jgi:hypothetical protein
VRLLASLCSRTEAAPDPLVVLDPANGSIETVPLPDPGEGAFGLCSVRGTIYCVVDRGRPAPDEPEQSELHALDASTLEVRWRYPFTLGRDVHSVTARADALYAASTGTDAVLRLLLDDEGKIVTEELFWQLDPGGEGTDRHHLNSLDWVDESLLVSALGRRPDDARWSDVRDGFVWDVQRGRRVLGPLFHPHSVCRIGGEIAVCESPQRRVVTSAGRTSQPLPGYARGLCPAGGKLYVGTSRGRHPDEPHSILSYEDGIGIADAVCAVCRLDMSLALERVYELAPHGREVYDLVVLD